MIMENHVQFEFINHGKNNCDSGKMVIVVQMS